MPRCYLTKSMKSLWDGMFKDYVKHLEDVKDVVGLEKNEVRCDWFLDDCVKRFREKYADEFKTTPYGEKQTIIDEEEWCAVFRLKFTNFYYNKWRKENTPKPAQPSLLKALNLVKPDTGRTVFAKALRTASSAEKSRNSGSPSKKSKTSGSSISDSIEGSITEKRAQSLRQLGPYQTTLKEVWDGLPEAEREQWEQAAKQANAPLDEGDDGDIRINENRELIPVALVRLFQGLMGFRKDQLGNCVFNVNMGWREEKGGSAVLNSLTITKDGDVCFMDELEDNLRGDLESAWSVFCENVLPGGPDEAESFERGSLPMLEYDANNANTDALREKLGIYFRELWKACQSDDQEMPTWEDILDAPEQYLVLDDSLSELNLGEPATMDIDTVFRLTLMIFARQTLGDATLPISFRDQSVFRALLPDTQGDRHSSLPLLPSSTPSPPPHTMNDDANVFALQASSQNRSVVELSGAGEGPVAHSTDEDDSSPSPSPTQMVPYFAGLSHAQGELVTPLSTALPCQETMSVHSAVVTDTPTPSNPPSSPDGRKRKGGAQRGERTSKRSRKTTAKKCVTKIVHGPERSVVPGNPAPRGAARETRDGLKGRGKSNASRGNSGTDANSASGGAGAALITPATTASGRPKRTTASELPSRYKGFRSSSNHGFRSSKESHCQ